MLHKYASAVVLEAGIAPKGASLVKDAHRHEFQYDPRPGFLYVRSRAISSRCNDNFDEFPAEEIKQAYRTFVGKPVFVNHHNDNHRRARGVIVDATLHEDVNPDGSPDTWCEVLMEVDAVRFPKLAQAILAGEIDRTSMGTDVAYSLCSFCGNRASTPLEYCAHIPKLKGKRIRRTTASGTREDVLVREICHGLSFFENSLLVEEPADPTAFFLGVDDRGLQTSVSGRHTAVADPEGWSDVSTAPIVKEVRKRRGWLLHDETRAEYMHAGYRGWVEQGRYGGSDFAAEIDWGGGGREYLGKGGYASAKSAMDAIERRLHRQVPPGDRPPSEELFYAGDDAPQRWQRRPLAARTAAKLAYGETLAPPKVDTMRDETCPVCAEEDSYDGERCLVCGFTKPPDQFMDPDLDAAKEMDLRQEQDDQAAADGGGNLACDNCGATFNDDSGDAPDGETPAFVPQGTTDEDKDQQRQEQTPPQDDRIPDDEKKVDPNNAAKPDPDPRTDPAKMQNTLPKPKRDGEVDADPDNAAKPDPAPKQEDAVPETAPKAGDACPTCGEGTLQPKSAPAEPTTQNGEKDEAEEEEGDDKDGKKPSWLKDKKKSARVRDLLLEALASGDDIGAADVLYPSHRAAVGTQKEQSMAPRPALAALAEQQRLIDAQATRINELETGLAFIAELAGVPSNHPKIAALVKRADVDNPAQPIPDPPAEPAPQTTEEALAPDGKDDVTSIGDTPVTDVSADATTSVEARQRRHAVDTVLDEELDLNEQDPTRPVAGTEEMRPLDEVRTETEVRVGDPNKSETAFPLQGDFAQRPTLSAKDNEGRQFAALRLARLRIQAGIDSGDDLAMASTIASSEQTDEAIQTEIDTLAKVVSTAAQRPAAPRNLVPRAASQVQRTTPSMASGDVTVPIQAVASSPSEDEFAFE